MGSTSCRWQVTIMLWKSLSLTLSYYCHCLWWDQLLFWAIISTCCHFSGPFSTDCNFCRRTRWVLACHCHCHCHCLCHCHCHYLCLCHIFQLTATFADGPGESWSVAKVLAVEGGEVNNHHINKKTKHHWQSHHQQIKTSLAITSLTITSLAITSLAITSVAITSVAITS